MIVLAVDTALAACSAALLRGDGAATALSLPMARGHAEALMPMLEDLTETAGIGYGEVDRFAVTVGPGTFTGVRVGVSAVRGLALATGRPACGVTTLAALAETARLRGIAVPLAAAVDARRGEIYLQCFAADGTPLDAPRAVAVSTAAATLDATATATVGSAAAMLAGAAAALGRRLDVAGEDAAPDPLAVARLGRHAAGPPHPLYLRPADARPQDAARVARR